MIRPFAGKKLVIFDMDGTLLDALPIHSAAVQKEFKEILGLTISAESTYSCYGRPVPEFMACVLEKHNHVVTDKIIQQLIDAHNENVPKNTDSVHVLPHVVELLDFLVEEGVFLTIATGSPRKAVESILNRANLSHYFKVVVCGDDHWNGRPIRNRNELVASAFEKSSKNTAFSKKEALVVGDTISDVTAAQFNQLDSLAVATGMAKLIELQQVNPTWFCSSFEELEF